MSVSLKTQVQSRGQYGLHAKCRYCGNAWFPFGEKTFDPPVDAVVKCTKCKSKQHIHWVRVVSTAAPAGRQPMFSKSLGFEQKKPPPEIKTASEQPAPPLIKQDAPEIAPLPELNEKPEQKQETKPIFKSRLLQSGVTKQDLKPIFKASTRLQKSEPPVATKAEIKPAVPAPVREIKIEDEPSPAREVKIEELKQSEIRPFETHEIEAHQTGPEVRAESRPVEEEKPAFRVTKPGQEPKIEVKNAKSEVENDVREHLEKPQEPRSMFKSQSAFKPENKSGAGSMFKSRLRHDLKQESMPPVDVPEVAPERGTSPEPEQKKVERHPGRPRTRRESLFSQKKSEVEVRESPLDDEPEVENAPQATAEAEPKPVFSSGWPSRKKPKKRLAEELDEDLSEA